MYSQTEEEKEEITVKEEEPADEVKEDVDEEEQDQDGKRQIFLHDRWDVPVLIC